MCMNLYEDRSFPEHASPASDDSDTGLNVIVGETFYHAMMVIHLPENVIMDLSLFTWSRGTEDATSMATIVRRRMREQVLGNSQ